MVGLYDTYKGVLMRRFNDVMSFLEKNEALDALVDDFSAEGIPGEAWVTFKRYPLTTDEFEIVMYVISGLPGRSAELFAIVSGSIAAEFVYNFK